MTKITELIVNGVSYDPYNVPPKIKEECSNRLMKALLKVLNEDKK
jgi:hypothetical protein